MLASQIPRIFAVSNVLLEQSILALKQENEKLKLTIFWKDHGIKEMLYAMAFANSMSTDCKCSTCMARDQGGEEYVYECRFNPWFEERLAECGIETSVGVTTDQHKCTFIEACNTHIVHAQDWSSFTYGSKLWNAKSVGDPELKKLAKLFKVLSMTE
jgi:hypothetical protein